MKLITENNWLVSIIDSYDIEFVVKVTIPDDNEDLKRVQEIDPSVKRDIYIYCNKEDLNLKDFENTRFGATMTSILNHLSKNSGLVLRHLFRPNNLERFYPFFACPLCTCVYFSLLTVRQIK